MIAGVITRSIKDATQKSASQIIASGAKTWIASPGFDDTCALIYPADIADMIRAEISNPGFKLIRQS